MRLFVPLSVIADEEEQLVALDRSTESPAELVEMVRAFPCPGSVVDQRIGIQTFVPVKLECSSVEFIGATAGDDVDHAPAGAADLGWERTGIHLKFLDRILAERVGTKTGPARRLAEEEIVRVRAVHQQRIVRAALAAKGEIAAASRILNHTGRQNGEIDEVSAIDGQVDNRPGVDGRGNIRTRGFDQRDFLSDRHGFSDTANFQLSVNRDNGTDGQQDLFLSRSLEARRFYGQVVVPGGQATESVETSVRGFHGARQPSGRAVYRDLCTSDNGVRWIGHNAIERSAANLRLREQASTLE